ncbi:MAG: CBS domain-containing protein [Candidatus Methylomirabilales bacterium]
MPRNVLREEVQELQRRGTVIAEVSAEAMEEAPLTIRPDTPLPEARDRMREGDPDTLLVTDNEGRLMGALYREDAERALRPEPARAGDRR